MLELAPWFIEELFSCAGCGAGPFSTGARISMWVLVAGQVAFASVLSWFQPHIDKFKWITQVVSVWLETFALLYSAILQENSSEASRVMAHVSLFLDLPIRW